MRIVFSLLGTTSIDPSRGLSNRAGRFVRIIYRLEYRVLYCLNKAVKGDASSPCCAGFITLLMQELNMLARQDGRTA